MKFKVVKNSKFYFFTEDMMPLSVRNAYEAQLVELDDEAEQVEKVLGDVSSGSMDEMDAARLENLRTRTAVLSQKLDEQKQAIWTEWNRAVFEEFSEAFAKIKNNLINLHLNEKQIKELNAGIDTALKNLEDRLTAMWNKFKNGEDEE